METLNAPRNVAVKVLRPELAATMGFAAGGRPRLLVRFNNPTFANARSEFATDGKRLYFTADDRQRDLRVMEVRVAR